MGGSTGDWFFYYVGYAPILEMGHLPYILVVPPKGSSEFPLKAVKYELRATSLTYNSMASTDWGALPNTGTRFKGH
jgi:hypothetical protein